MTIIVTTPAAPLPYALDFIEVGKVCDDCAVVIANDDDSMLTEDQAQSVRASIAAIRRDIGPDLFVGDPRDDGATLYRCAICGDDTISDGRRAVVAIDTPVTLNPLTFA